MNGRTPLVASHFNPAYVDPGELIAWALRSDVPHGDAKVPLHSCRAMLDGPGGYG